MSQEPGESGGDRAVAPPAPLPYRSGIDDTPPRGPRWWWPFARLVIYAVVFGFLFFFTAAAAIFGSGHLRGGAAIGVLLVMLVMGLGFFPAVRSAISIARGESNHPFAEDQPSQRL